MNEREPIIGAPEAGEPAAGALDGPEFARPVEALAAREAELAAERGRFAAAITRLKAALAVSEPGLDPALIAGDTVEDVEASFAAAREVLRRLRDDVRREAAAAVPAGGTGRVPVPRMTPFEKIRAGIVRLS